MNEQAFSASQPNGGSWVIEAAFGKGYYRHIKIASNVTLEQLGDAICVAFGLERDRLHAFYLDNWLWSKTASYYRYSRFSHSFAAEDTRYTRDVTLGDVLHMEDQFKFVLDARQPIIVACRVLRKEDDLPAPREGSHLSSLSEREMLQRSGMQYAERPAQGICPVYALSNGAYMQIVLWRGRAKEEQSGLFE